MWHSRWSAWGAQTDYLDHVFELTNEGAVVSRKANAMANQVSNQQGGGDQEAQTQPGIQVELRASLPGGRAFACVVQEDKLVWLASKEHISEQARDELLDLFQRVVEEGWLVQK